MKNLKIKHTVLPGDTPTLRVSSTAWPNGNVRKWPDGMPKPDVKCLGDIMKAAVMNEVRDGGICYSELSALEQAKKLLLTPRR